MDHPFVVQWKGDPRLVANLRTNALRVNITAGSLLGEVAVDFLPTTPLDAVSLDSGFDEAWLAVSLPVTYVPPTTGKSPYRLFVVDRYGKRFAELHNAGDIRPAETLNDYQTIAFTMPGKDPKVAECKIGVREVQLWRGTRVVGWYVITQSGNRGDGTIQFSGVDPTWHLSKRVIGRSPMPNRLKNPSFDLGLRDWEYTYKRGSLPASPPRHSTVTAPTITKGRALKLSANSTTSIKRLADYYLADSMFTTRTGAVLTPTGKTRIKRLVDSVKTTGSPSYTIDVYHSPESGVDEQAVTTARFNAIRDYIISITSVGVVVTGAGRGATKFIASNTSQLGRSKNRRVEMFARFTKADKHQQYARQVCYFMNPKSRGEKQLVTMSAWVNVESYGGASKDGILAKLYLLEEDPKRPGKWVVPQESVITVNKNTPLNRWIRVECAVSVPPNDNTYAVVVRLYPTAGTVYWDEVTVVGDYSSFYAKREQARIISELVADAQDTDLQKTDANIKVMAPLTKVKRTRNYPWIERMETREAIYEFTTLGKGVDISMHYTATSRTLVTHYPRRGKNKGYVFDVGRNVIDFSLTQDAEQMASRVIVQAKGDTATKEEGVVTDLSQTDGMLFEKVYNATPGSPVSSLDAQAARGIKRYGKPASIAEVVVSPAYTEELLTSVEIGDIVTVKVNNGWQAVASTYRVTGMAIDTQNDSLSYTITPWDGLGEVG